MRGSQIFLILCIGLGVVALCALGTWQLQRLAWKESLIARVQAGLSAEPISVQEVESEINQGRDIEYRPSFATGRFHHDKEQHFFATHKSAPGYFIFTPLELEDGRMLFVNRGHVPMVRKENSGRVEGNVDGIVKVSGLARSAPSQKPNSFVPNNDLAKNVFYWKSLSQMAGHAYDKMNVQTVGYFLDADDTPVPGGLPVGGVTLIQFPNSHLQYAMTWFGLAASLLGVGGYFAFTRRRSASNLT